MRGFDSSSSALSDAETGEVAPSGSASSWTNSADVEIQRDLVARRVFERDPVTIDRFEVEKLVGAGASAAVYAARDPLLDRRVAIKVLGRVREGRIDAAMERWIREARALAHLSHPNVVAIYDVGQWNDRPFIAMELIEGATLAQWLVAQRRSTAEILAVFRAAGAGLAAAHARGHVHRDFKPANVLVAHDGRVVVSDFGLVDDTAQSDAAADASDRGASQRKPLGTPAYVAPEQRAGAAAHPSADVYSFALALVESVLGSHPMPESTVTWKSALRHRVSRRLHRELCAAMAPEPRHRAQSLGPLLDALAPRRGVRRRYIAGALAAGAAVAMIAMAARGGREEPASIRPAQTPSRAPIASLMPAEIVNEVQALLAIVPDGPDRSWSERARAVLMLPIPTQVPCRWPATPILMEIIGDDVVALDQQARLLSCAIATGLVTTVADDVICVRPADDATFGVAFRDGRIAVYQRRSGWVSVPVAGGAVLAGGASAPDPYCPFIVSSHGVVPPQIRLTAQRRDDFAQAVAGGRTLFHKPDQSVWIQAGNAPPTLLIRMPQALRFDRALSHAVVATDARMQVVDLATMSVVADAPGPTLGRRVDIASDGSAAVAVGGDHRLLWWRRGMQQWHSQPMEANSPTLRISPRGERVLIAGTGGGLEVRDLLSGRRYPLAVTAASQARFLDDDRVVMIDASGAVWRWSLGRARSWMLADHESKPETWMWGFAVCDHGSSVITATSREDDAIVISSPRGGPQRILTRPPDARIYGIACDGDRVFAGTHDGHVLEWQWPTGRRLADHDVGVRAWVWTIATAQPVAGPRVSLFGTGQIFDPQNRVGGRVVALRDGSPAALFTARFGSNTGISEIAVSADRRHAVAIASSGEVVRLDLVRGVAGPPAIEHAGEVRRVRHADGDRLVVTAGDDGNLRTWRADDLSLQRQIYVGQRWIVDLDVHGTTALVATIDGDVSQWDLVTGRLVLDHGHHGTVAQARFDASGRWIVRGDSTGHACVLRAGRDGCHVALVGHKPAKVIRHMTFLDDGQIITASDDGTVWQWNPPYESSNAALACELESYLFHRTRGQCDMAK